MSNSKRDQRGGHRRQHCDCLYCRPITTRSQRKNAAVKHEKKANG